MSYACDAQPFCCFLAYAGSAGGSLGLSTIHVAALFIASDQRLCGGYRSVFGPRDFVSDVPVNDKVGDPWDPHQIHDLIAEIQPEFLFGRKYAGKTKRSLLFVQDEEAKSFLISRERARMVAASVA